MADQKTSQLDTVRQGEVEHGGKRYPCWFVQNNYFLRRVQDNFNSALILLPTHWERWLQRLGDEQSPMRHLMSVRYDASLEKWVRPKDHVDDLYYAAMFAEVALYLHLRKVGLQQGGGQTARAVW